MDKCFECGDPAQANHYVVPKILGGTKEVPLCNLCHGKVHRTPIQLISEILLLEDLWGKTQGQRTDIDDETSLKKHGFKSTRDRIANKLKISPATISKLKFIHKIEPGLFEGMGPNGTLTMSAAFSQCKMRENQKRIIQDSKSTLDK